MRILKLSPPTCLLITKGKIITVTLPQGNPADTILAQVNIVRDTTYWHQAVLDVVQGRAHDDFYSVPAKNTTSV